MTHTRRELLAAVSGAAVVGLAGCTSGGGPGAETDTPTATSTPGGDATPTDRDTPTATSAGTEAPSAAQQAYPSYKWSKLESADPVATDTVAMSGFAFDPLIATVPPGTTVSFPNKDSTKHTVTVPALDVDRTVSGGGKTSVTFPKTGTFDYVCKFHGPGMLGRVVVEEGVTLDGGGGGGTTTTTTDSGGGGGYGDGY